MKIAIFFITAIISYLIGGINPAIVLSKLIYKKDIRNEGSKNPGFTNFKRVFGMKWAWLVMLLDLAKAFVLEAIFGLLFEKILGEGNFALGVAFTGMFIMFGHAFPIWYKFSGGKAYLVILSTLWMLNWKIGLCCTLFMMIFVVIVKYMSLATLLSIILGAIFLPIFGLSAIPSIIYAFCVLFVIFRHKENLKRLFKGEEAKTYFFKSKKDVWSKSSK